MERSPTHHIRYLLGGIIGLPLLIAIAIPLYLSGSPSLSASSIPLTEVVTSTPNVLAITSGTPDIAEEPASTTTVPTEVTDEATSEPEPELTQRPALPQNEAVVGVVSALLENQSGVYGIIIEQPGMDPEFSQNEDIPFLAASLYKLVLLADVYEGIQNGVVSPDAELLLLPEYFPVEGEPADSYFDTESAPETVTVTEALFATGAYSSNVAALALLSLTDEISLEATAREIGMDHTYFYVDPRDLAEWPPTPGPDDDPEALAESVTFIESTADSGPLMITTPRDIATYFNELMSDGIVDADVSAQILEILTQQVVDDRFPCLLPGGTEMAHKTGNLDHVVHDTGIIWSPEGPMILVAMAQDPEDDGEATLVIQQLAVLAYTTLSDPYVIIETPPASICVEAEGTEVDPATEVILEEQTTEEPVE